MQKYWYDANGNQTTRIVNGNTYTLSYDGENRLTSVSGYATATFVYDGDGKRVKGTIGNVTTYYIGNSYEYSTQQSGITPVQVTPLNSGVACQDGATGSGYLLYSAESVHERFADNPPFSTNADHFICVKYISGQWNYDDNVAYHVFTPEEGDILVASINYDTDVITSQAGQNSTTYGIARGYASGNLGYVADQYGGAANDGEFTVTGSSFTPNKLVIARKYYTAGGTRVAMREAGTLYFLLSDHLGGTNVTVDREGEEFGEVRYKAFGDTRYTSGTTPTTMRYTGQRQESTIGLYYYGARWYDAYLNRWIQPDSIIPDPGNPLDFDRFAYARNNPLVNIDPSGHDAIPYEQMLQQCIDFFNGQGFEIVGNAIDAVNKNIHTNGADLVFKAQNAANVLAVEVKNVVGNVTLSTLGPKDAAGYYVGSIARTYASAQRFANSSVTQLKEESQAIIGAYESGNLQNALYTTASNVSAKAQDVFNYVYTNVDKVAAPAATATETFFQAAGNFLSSTETLFSGIFFYTPSPLLSDYEGSDT